MTSKEPNARLDRFFAGVAENTFQSQLGVADPALVDYITDLLIRFVRPESSQRIRSITGQPLVDIAEMVQEATRRLGDAKHEIHRYIGDFALFWANQEAADFPGHGVARKHLVVAHAGKSLFVRVVTVGLDP